MNEKEFYNEDQAQSYLSRCIISRAGRPIYVDSITKPLREQRFHICYRHLSNSDIPLVTYYPDGQIDLTPIPLGMYHQNSDSSHSAIYMARYPIRMWKIGLTSRNVSTMNVSQQSLSGVMPSELLFWTKEFEQMVQGEYPSFEKAMKTIGGSPYNTMPLSRHFATSGTELFFKALGEPVGKLTDNGYALHEPFFYLTESLQEELPYVRA